MQHGDHEYGEHVNEKGEHYGGPFTLQISPKMRIDELRKVIRVRELLQQGPCCGQWRVREWEVSKSAGPDIGRAVNCTWLMLSPCPFQIECNGCAWAALI